MIIYNKSLGSFKNDVLRNEIANILSDSLRDHHVSGGSDSEVRSWCNSLNYMRNVLDDRAFPDDLEVAIEYNIPQTAKRVDFMVVGSDSRGDDHVVIVELKQWAKVEKIDDCFEHTVMSDLRSHEPVPHPSYQAFSYKTLISDYCSTSLKEEQLNPCAYLHNMNEKYRCVLEDNLYGPWVKEAPVFLQDDFDNLRGFIKKYINAKSKDGSLLYKIEFGKIRPSKSLQDSLDSMLCGNEEFQMIDEQVVAYDFIMKAIDNARRDRKKHVVIISGGPGTGKSVLAVNVLADCIRKKRLNAAYITKNMAPRNCYKKLLSKGNARKEIDLQLAFRSPNSALPNASRDSIEVGLFDEAHRMQKQPYMYSGADMLADAIFACKVSVFFVDDDQRITVNDCYDSEAIIEYAKRAGAVIDTPTPYELTSQFRCNGSDGYVSFLNNMLGLKKTANTTLDLENFEFKVFDDPKALKDAIVQKNSEGQRSRVVAGYCYDWNVKYGRGEWDVVIGDFKAKWNLQNDSIYAINENSVNEIGCIHTVQGMEFGYVGVLIGKDLVYRNGEVMTDKTAVSRDDRTSGIRQCRDLALADKLIRNTYKVLMTRGLKGCYVFCEDKELSEYMKSIAQNTNN